MYRLNFYIDDQQRDALKAIKERDGIPEAEQIRRGVAMWLKSKGYAPKARGVKRKKK